MGGSLIFLVALLSVGFAAQAVTCGTSDEVKVFAQEIQSYSSSDRLFYLNDTTGDDENYLILLTEAGELLYGNFSAAFSFFFFF